MAGSSGGGLVWRSGNVVVHVNEVTMMAYVSHCCILGDTCLGGKCPKPVHVLRTAENLDKNQPYATHHIRLTSAVYLMVGMCHMMHRVS